MARQIVEGFVEFCAVAIFFIAILTLSALYIGVVQP